MFRAPLIKKLSTGEEISFKQGLCARANKDNTISLLLRGRISGDKKKSPITLAIARVSKLDKRLSNLCVEATQRALDYKQLMSSGIHPKEYNQEQEDLALSKTMTLSQALDKYDQVKQGTDSNKLRSVNDRRQNLNSICSDWMNKQVNKITANMILDRYLLNSSGQKNRRRVAELMFVHLRAIFNFLVSINVMEKNPCTSLKESIKVRYRKKKDNFLAPSEIKKLQRIIRNKRKEYNTDDLFLLQSYNFAEFLLKTGLRDEEAKLIKWKNIFEQGSELNANPYLVLLAEDRKQAEPYAIAITPDIEKIISRQKFLINPPINLSSLGTDLLNDDEEWDLNKKLPKYLFLCDKDFKKLKKSGLRKAKLTNEPVSNMRRGFAELKKELGKLSYAETLSPQILRHTFTTIGNMLGYSNSELASMTGHARPDGTATAHYVARIVKDNRQGFINIHKAMELEQVKDSDLHKLQDEFGKKLKTATKEQLIEYYQQGLLSEKEVKQYKVISLLKKSLKVSKDYLWSTKED